MCRLDGPISDGSEDPEGPGVAIAEDDALQAQFFVQPFQKPSRGPSRLSLYVNQDGPGLLVEPVLHQAVKHPAGFDGQDVIGITSV